MSEKPTTCMHPSFEEQSNMEVVLREPERKKKQQSELNKRTNFGIMHKYIDGS